MRVLKLIAAATLIFCAAWLVSCNVEWVNDTPTIPEGILSDTFSSWEPERVSELTDAGRGGIVCVEVWDMFKDGVYYKPLYETGIDRREAEHE